MAELVTNRKRDLSHSYDDVRAKCSLQEQVTVISFYKNQ